MEVSRKSRIKTMYLYRYFPLFKGKKKSNQRIAPLKKNQLWMSSVALLNDPTEFTFYCKENGWLNLMMSCSPSMLTTSFSKRWNSLPMWAHYANNHEGFVVKFKVDICDGNNLYKVNYVNNAPRISDVCRQCDKTYDKLSAEIENAFNNNDSLNLSNLFMNEQTLNLFCKTHIELCRIKHNDWKYENEYRLIIPEGVDFLKRNLISFEYAFMKPVKIFAGMYCSEENMGKLEELSKIWGIEKPIQMGIKDFYTKRRTK